MLNKMKILAILFQRRDPKWLIRNAVIMNSGRSKNISSTDPVRGKIPVMEGFHVWTYKFSQTLGPDDHYLIGIGQFYCLLPYF
jgi:hypothetical protein